MELSNISTKISKEYIVKKTQTAKDLGSGGLEVLATPQIVIWVENLAYLSLENILSDHQTSVGSEFEIKHKKLTTVNSMIKIKLSQKKINSKAYKFNFIVEDSKEIEVASGTHTRVVVETKQFLEKLK